MHCGGCSERAEGGGPMSESRNLGEAPLCVDLDHTLVRTNTLVETVVGVLRRNPALVFLLPFWAMRGQAHLWGALVKRFRPDAALLPYSEPALEVIRQAAATGGAVVLATGAHESVAQDVARHLGLFSEVSATSATEHLVGGRKADLLAARFGAHGFDYMGDSMEDMAAFRSCRQAYVVSPSRGVVARLKQESIAAIRVGSEAGMGFWQGLWSAVRPEQWVKNILVFAPILLGHRFTDTAAILACGFTCAVLCLASSSVYLLNDINDVEADRQHPAKRQRPFAQGAVSMAAGAVAGLGLAGLAVGLGWLVNPRVSLLLAAYLAGTMMYSVWLKQLLVVDMILLASFYVFRVYLGSAATGIHISSWTALFCVFIFSGVVAVKRYAEIRNRAEAGSDYVNRRAYRPEDAAPLLSIGASCFAGAIVALGLYLGTPDVRVLYRTPDLLWLVCPILLGWTSRLWILAHRGELGGEDPVAFVVRDRWSHGAAVLAAVVFALAV